MTVAVDAQLRAPITLNFVANLGIAIAALAMGSIAILRYHQHPALQTALDATVALTGVLIGLVFWNLSRRDSRSWRLFLAITFSMFAMVEVVHVLAVLGWLGGGAGGFLRLQAGNWKAPSFLLPLGIGAALLLHKRPRSFAWVFAVGLAVVVIALVAIFHWIPGFAQPGVPWIIQPTLLLAPPLWAAVGFAYWRSREWSEIAHAVALTAGILVIADSVAVFSRAPGDTVVMVAHLGRFVGYALLLFNLTQIGAADTARRKRAAQQLSDLNEDLDSRINERTARLREIRGRMHLLDQITHSIGQRHDVGSIFQVVVGTIEDRLPADFACICHYDPARHLFTVAHVGVRSAPLGQELGIIPSATMAIDRSGLSRSVAGELIYEPDIGHVDTPFANRLAQQGLRSLVVVPISFDDAVFGMLLVSRRKESDFLSTDCEFLRQLGEHVGLAAHQTQLRDSLKQSYDDLKQTQLAVIEQERLRAIGQMASGIAHDINNAISPIALYTQALLDRRLDLTQDVRDYLELVGRVVKDVAATVSRLRDFYRADDDLDEFAPVDLNELVKDVVELTRARWSDMPQQRGVVIKVETELAADLSPVLGSASELREGMTNLIFNAVDAMPEGGTLTIRTETLVGGADGRPQVRLEIGDTGAGMDEETRRRCYEAFFTTKGERGTGLGLAMVQRAAQRHQAKLDIESAPGAGTRMRLDFNAAEATLPDKTPLPVTPDTRPLHLLLVDDDPAVLKSTALVLTLYGHTVAAADGGQAGIDTIRAALGARKPFDVIITDLGMPYVDGNQVALAAKEMFPETPVVLLTGWGRRMATSDEAPAHIDFVLSKPLHLHDLWEVFARIEQAAIRAKL